MVKYNVVPGQFITISRNGQNVTFSLNTQGAEEGDAVVFSGGIPTWGTLSSGREIELRATDTHLQWRYVGDADWVNLIALEDVGEVEQGFDIVYNNSGVIEKLVFDDNTETVFVYDGDRISQVITPTKTKTLLYSQGGSLIGVEVT
jgi:hypothetical protein